MKCDGHVTMQDTSSTEQAEHIFKGSDPEKAHSAPLKMIDTIFISGREAFEGSTTFSQQGTAVNSYAGLSMCKATEHKIA